MTKGGLVLLRHDNTTSSGDPLVPGPLYVAISLTNLKSIVGKCRGGVPGLECGSKEEKPMTAQIL